MVDFEGEKFPSFKRELGDLAHYLELIKNDEPECYLFDQDIFQVDKEAKLKTAEGTVNINKNAFVDEITNLMKVKKLLEQPND